MIIIKILDILSIILVRTEIVFLKTLFYPRGSSFNKNEINCNLNGNYSSTFVNGIISLMNDQQHEIRTSINHLDENTKSYQLIKSVLGKRF